MIFHLVSKFNLRRTVVNKPIRHGEVILIPVEKMAAGRPKKAMNFIVGHSETGHHHVLESEVPMSVQDKDFLVRLFEPAKLVHKKETNAHNTLTVPAGTYKVLHKTEFDPFQSTRREVWD
jgi:hypothetical protein